MLNCRVCHFFHRLLQSLQFGQVALVTVIQAWLVSAVVLITFYVIIIIIIIVQFLTCHVSVG